MNVIKKINYILSNKRFLHFSVIHNGQGRIMKKIMGGTTKKKFKYHEEHFLPTPSTISSGAKEGKKSSNSKRANVLNKLFMRYITDLMSSGECSPAFLGHGIEINRVQVTADFSCVRMYWSSRSLEKDDTIEKVLDQNVGKLRHELAQLKVVGVIPRLQFVKDKQFAELAKVDRLLAIADYGDDYEPIDLGSKLKTELQIHTNLNANIIKEIEKLDQKVNPDDFDDLPPMPNNVFGLNHTSIMERIENATKKSKALHRLKPVNNTEPLPSVNTHPILLSNDQEKQAFQEFIEKQQILKNKLKREIKNQEADLEYIREDDNQDNLDNCMASEENDFIDDDFNDHNK